MSAQFSFAARAASIAVCLSLSASFAAEPAPLSGTAPVQPPAKKFQLLFLTQSMGFKHAVVTRPTNGALSVAESALAEIGKQSGVFDAECTQDATQITPQKLKTLDALVFFTSGDLPIKPAAFSAIQDWLRGGKAFIGIHSAADTFKEFRPYYEMLGATYLRHPWTHGATVINLDREHPATRMFPAQFEWNDELCEYRYFDSKKVRVLLALDMAQSEPKLPKLVPVSWVRDYGKGRVFYTNFGNSEAIWNEELFRAHLLNGMRWALKLDEGSTEPNPDATAKVDTNARLAVLDTEKSWLAKAAKTVAADPPAILAAAEKIAAEDKARFLKLHEQIAAAIAGEKSREAALKKNQQPGEADMKLVRSRRAEIIAAIQSK
ncbi:MAG TPA: ThuA domain-containing protein [Planctomycetota bacterium]|nr:ThuA domain-containing protein [Planctomycetota bacterium]